jgi:hypothetical protein
MHGSQPDRHGIINFMDKVELDDKIVVYSNFFDNPMSFAEEADIIFQKFPKLKYKLATINKHEYNPDIRSCKVFSLNTQALNHDVVFGSGSKTAKNVLNKMINKKTFDCMNDYFKTYNFSIKTRESWELLEYKETQKLAWHSDHGDSHPCQVSFVYYFNDDYIGGEVEFKNYIGSPYKPKAGDLLIFPSSPEYIHRVLPIESGTKYNAISFAK